MLVQALPCPQPRAGWRLRQAAPGATGALSMNFLASLSTIGVLLAAMIALSLVEAVIPLRGRGALGRRRLSPSVALAFVACASNLVLNLPLLLGLAWLQR